MRAAQALSYLHANGVVVLLDGDDLVLYDAEWLSEETINHLRAIKPDLVAEVRRTTGSAARRVIDLREQMAAENARRRNWWRDPVEGWREGRLVIRSALSGEVTTVITFDPRGN